LRHPLPRHPGGGAGRLQHRPRTRLRAAALPIAHGAAFPGPAACGVWGMWLYQRGLQPLVRASHLLWLRPAPARPDARVPPVSRPTGWRDALRDATSGTSEVTLIAGCVMDAAFGSVHAATARVLARNGIRTRLPEGQGCCGALHLHAGDEEAAVTLAKINIATFEAAGEQPILVNSAGCGALLKDYGKLLAHDAAWQARPARLSKRVRDVSEFVARLPLQPPRLEVKVAYDDPCHLVHAQKVREPPRQMLGQIPGLTLVPLREA